MFKKILITVIAVIFFTLPGYAVESAGNGKTKPSVSKVSNEALDEKLSNISELIKKGELVKAKESYKKLLSRALDKAQAKKVRKELDDLNIKILFSPVKTENTVEYEVQPGDALWKIAKKYDTTVEMIKKSNYLSKDTIRTGLKLRVMKGPFTIHVDKSANTLKLFQGDELLKTYSVSTGEKNSTPIGKFTIEVKLENPTWYKAGMIAPPNSPDNILGTRWMGFSLQSYGIHGTTLPETIGKQASAGCVRMLNKEVEELYDIVPLKTEVTVVD